MSDGAAVKDPREIDPPLTLDPKAITRSIRARERREMVVIIAAHLAARFIAESPLEIAQMSVAVTDAIIAELEP